LAEIEASARGDDAGDGRLDRILLADVDSNVARRAAVAADFILYGCELVGLASGEHDVRAKRRELVGGAAADPAAGAGDEDGMAREQARSEHAAVAHGERS
jgi:hypothetical protein